MSRDPNWDDASDSATIVIEKTTPVEVTIAPTIDESIERAAGGDNSKMEYESKNDWPIVASNRTKPIAAMVAAIIIIAGTNQKLERI